MSEDKQEQFARIQNQHERIKAQHEQLKLKHAQIEQRIQKLLDRPARPARPAPEQEEKIGLFDLFLVVFGSFLAFDIVNFFLKKK